MSKWKLATKANFVHFGPFWFPWFFPTILSHDPKRRSPSYLQGPLTWQALKTDGATCHVSSVHLLTSRGLFRVGLASLAVKNRHGLNPAVLGPIPGSGFIFTHTHMRIAVQPSARAQRLRGSEAQRIRGSEDRVSSGKGPASTSIFLASQLSCSLASPLFVASIELTRWRSFTWIPVLF